MISSLDLRNTYCDLYAEIRKYLWDVKTLEILAELEVECYTAFPDMERVRNILSRLRSAMNSAIKEDEYLEKEFNELDSLVSESLEYHPLYRIQEVVVNEN